MSRQGVPDGSELLSAQLWDGTIVDAAGNIAAPSPPLTGFLTEKIAPTCLASLSTGNVLLFDFSEPVSGPGGEQLTLSTFSLSLEGGAATRSDEASSFAGGATARRERDAAVYRRMLPTNLAFLRTAAFRPEATLNQGW